MADLGSAVGQIILNYDPSGVAAAKSDLGSLESAGDKMTKMGGVLAGVGAAIGAPLIGAISSAADLEQSMDKVGVAFGVVEGSSADADKQFAALGDTVQDVASTTIFGAQDVAQAATILGKAGVSVEDATGGMLQGVADFAAATDTSLPVAADIMTRSAAQWGVAGEDMGATVDDLTTAMNSTSLSSEDLLGGMANLAPMMKVVGGTMQDTAATLGFFKDQGLSAREAGTSLTSALQAMVAPNKTQTAAMTELGLATADFFRINEQGQEEFIGWADALDLINGSMGDLTTSQRAAALESIFGREAFDALGLGILADTDKLRDLSDEMEHNDGVARTQSEALTDNLKGAIEELGGATDVLQAKMGDPFLGPLQAGVEGITSFVKGLSGLDPAILGFVGKMASATAGIASFAGVGAIGVGQVLKLGQAFRDSGLSLGKFAAGLGLVGVAIAAGILAYETNFLGFRDTVEKALGAAGKAIKTFGDTFGLALSKGRAKGLNDIAAGIAAVGEALQAATGIDITGFTDTLAQGAQAFGAAFEAATEQGLSPFVAALEGASAAAAEMGFEGIAEGLAQAADAAEQFGNTFGEAFRTGQDQGLNDIAAAAQAVGVGLSELLGVDVTGFFGKLSDGAQALGDQFEKLAAATQQALGQALSGLMNNVLPGFQDALGNVLGTIRDVGAALLSGDFSQAGQILGDALGELGGAIGNAFEQLRAMDWSGILGGIGSAIGSALGSIASTVGGLIGDINWDGVVSAIGATLSAAFDGIGALLSPIASAIGSAISEALGSVGEFVTNIDWTGVVQNVADMILAAFQGLSGLLGDLAQTASDAIMEQLNQIGQLIEGDSMGGPGERGGMGVFDAVAESLKQSWDALFEGLGLTPPDPSFILDPLGQALASAAAGIDALFQPVVDAINTATLHTLQALSGLPNVDFSSDIAALQENLFGMSQETADMMAQVVTGAGLGAIPPPDTSQLTATEVEAVETAFDDALTGQTEAADEYVDDLDRVIQTERAEQEQVLAEAAPIDFEAVKSQFADSAHNFVEAATGAFIPTAVSAAELPPEGADAARASIADQLSTIAPDEAALAKPATDAGKQMATDFVTQLAGGMTEAISAAPTEQFAAAGTALMEKVGTSISQAMATAPDSMGGPGERGEAGTASALATDLVSGLATSLEAAVAAEPVETFQPVGTALGQKLQQALGTALTTTAAGETGGLVGADAAGGAAGNMMEALATSLAASVTAAPPEAFLPVGQALSQKLQSALSTAMQISPSAMLGGGAGMTGTGDTTMGGGGEAIVVSLANSLASQITAASPESFAAVGQALSQKLQQVLSTAMSTAPSGAGGNFGPGGMLGTGGGTGGGIGTQIATMIATQVQGADFSAAGQALQTKITEMMTTAGTAIATGGAQWASEFANAITNITTVVTNGFTSLQTAINTAITGIQTSIQALVPAIEGIATAVGAAMQTMTTTITSAFAAMQSAVNAAVSALQASVQGIVTALNQVAAAAGTAAGAIGDAIVAALDADVAAVEAAAGRLGAAATVPINTAIQPGSPSRVVLPWAESIPEALVTGMSDGLSAVSQAADALTDAIMNAVGGANTPQVQAAGEQMGAALGTGIGTGISQSIPDVTNMASQMIEQITGDTWSRIKGQWGGEMPAWAHQVQQLANDRRSSALGDDGQPVQIHLTTELDGQALDDRIIDTSIGGLMKVPGRGAGRNGMRVR